MNWIDISSSLLQTIAAAAPATGNKPPASFSIFGQLAPFLLLGVVFYVLILMPKRKQDRQYREMMAGLKKNDRVQTVGGIFGTVIEVRDDRVHVKVDESSNTKLWFSRSAIKTIETADAKVEAKTA